MVFSALDPLADPAVHEIPRRSGDGQGVNHRNQDKRQLAWMAYRNPASREPMMLPRDLVAL
mgnify:CR=1 FL=1|jgi:hypothetical protein